MSAPGPPLPSRWTRFPPWLSSVRAVMILLIALATISPLVIIFYQSFQHKERALSDGRTVSGRIAAQVAYDQQLLLSSAEQLMSTFPYIPAIRRRDTVAVNALLADLLRKNPQITNLLVADEKGNTWASGLPMKGPIHASDRRYFRNAVATGRFSSGEFNIGRLRNKPALLFGYPLKDRSGRITDVAIVSFSLDMYDRYFQSKGLVTEASLALFDYKGTVLFARPTISLIGKRDGENLFHNMTAGPDEGSFEAVGLTGVHRVFTYRKLRLPGESQPYMYVRAGISVSSILDRTRYDFLFGMGSIAVASTLILLASVLLSKRFVLDKVAALKETTRRISRGDLGARVPEIVSGGELGELGNAFDIMACKLQEADTERRKSEERFRAVAQSASDAIITADSAGNIVGWNRGAGTIFGYSEAEISGQPATLLMPSHYHDGHLAGMARMRTGGEPHLVGKIIQMKGLRKDGSEFPIEVSMSNWEVADGRFYTAIIRDITGRKRAEDEKEKLHAQLQHAMKMEAVGRLAGGVAHDFNNMLTVITGYSELLLRKIGKESRMHGEVEEIKRAGERAASLTQQLLAFSRKQIIEPKVVRLDLLVTDMQAMLTRLVGENIALHATAGMELGSVKVDPGMFQQILMNLAVNAKDAMPAGGKIVIETANADLDEEFCATRTFVTPGRYLMLAVSDTGTGMSDEIKAHVFEPFFTTKKGGKGTGLGLATTYGAVHQAGGFIEVHSEVGIGTTFKIYLPRVDGEAVIPVNDDPPRDLPGGTETVLLVEDEETVRNLCAQILEGLGYRVLQAWNGIGAITVSQKYGDRIDLLLTDVVMPGMTGADLATRLALHRPEMKVLFTSGYTYDVISRHGVLDKGKLFIAKPYTPSALARKVREVLGKA